MRVSKVTIEFRAVDDGEPLGEATVFVATKGSGRKEIVREAMAKLQASKEETFDEVEHVRSILSVETVNLRRWHEAAETLGGWGLEPEDLNVLTDVAAGLLRQSASDDGLSGQVEFLCRHARDWAADEIALALAKKLTRKA